MVLIIYIIYKIVLIKIRIIFLLFFLTNLFNLLTIKIKSLTLGISKINIKRNFIDITFKKASQKILDDLIQMAQENIIKMQSSSSIQIKNNDSKDLFYTINLFYKKLGLK